jgi:pimeloyl-ACP methyl ester carboxylesterase
MIEDEFGRIDYDEIGQGPTVVLVPGSCSTGAAWRPSLHNGRTVFAASPQVCSGMAARSLVLWGEASHPAAKRANELLGQSIPNAGVATIAGAAHFMISTHAREVAGMIAQHVARTEHNGRAATELRQ